MNALRVHKPYDSTQQSGMVAILVTMILMIVISLIVLGFAQISRRNQREALDQQLSAQAFYAAETGVNDAAHLISQAGGTVSAKPDCNSTGGGFYSSLNPVIDGTNKVQYTCLMVNPIPNVLAYSDVGTQGQVIPLNPTSGTISKIVLDWQPKDGSSTPAANCPTSKTNIFSPTGSWTCGYGVLRFDLVPTNGALSMSGLQSLTMTSFVVPLRPGSGGGTSSAGYATGGANDLVGVVCSQTDCKLTITGLNRPQYYLRVSSLYKDVSLTVTALNASGNAMNLAGVQAVIDSTGQAQDVLRRLQVRIPLGNAGSGVSDYALQSTEAICKRFSVMDGYFQSDANNAVPGVGSSTSNPLCQ